MPYIYSREEIDAQTLVKPKAIHLTEDHKPLPESEQDNQQTTVQPKFMIANMFGPIDWAMEVSTETDSEPVEKESSWVVDANMFGPMDWAAEIEAATEDAVPLKPAA